jgi:hypothetical protein
VKLFVDLETLALIEGPGFRNPVGNLRFKRGDGARLEVVFLRNGTSPQSLGDPAGLSLQFGVKPRGRYDVGYLVQSTDWTLPAADAESPIYQCSPSFNTNELNAALQIDQPGQSELAEVLLMGEITWSQDGGEPTSTRTFLVIVENDVNRGDEGVPTGAAPSYPAPQDIATLSALGTAIYTHESVADPHPQYLRHDISETLSEPAQAAVRSAIAAAEVAPDPDIPMVLLGGTWYPAVFQGTPDNADVLGWGVELNGTAGSVLRAVAGPGWAEEDLVDVQIFIPPPGFGLNVYLSGTSIFIELATDEFGAAYQDAGSPNSLDSVASALDSLNFSVTVLGDGTEAISSGEGGPFGYLTSGAGTPGWRGRLAVDENAGGSAHICLKDDLSETNTGWRKIVTVGGFPPIKRRIALNNYENYVSLDVTLTPGTSYRVRFDNLSEIPSHYFGLGFVALGAGGISDIQFVDGAFLTGGLFETADFLFELDGSPASASDCFAEFTFRADVEFEWAGYSMYGSWEEDFRSIELDVTITQLP